HLRQTRTLRPSPRILRPMRVCAPHSGQISCTLDACSDASRSTMPPLMLRPGFGLVWRLIMFTPSTTRRLAAGTIFNTRPRLPRSLPAMTSTLSFLRIGLCSCDITIASSSQLPASSPPQLGAGSSELLQHLWRELNNLHEPA